MSASSRLHVLVVDDNADTLAARVLAREHQLLPQVVRWFAEGKLALQGEQVLLNGQPLAAPLQL